MDIRFRRDYSRANGYKLDGADSILPGAKEYIDRIPGEDRIAILTPSEAAIRAIKSK